MSSQITLSHAKRLRFLRKFFDKKQIEVAEILQLSQQAYSKLENGETTFSNIYIEKLAAFFNISTTEFENSNEFLQFGKISNNNTNSNTYVIDPSLIHAINKTVQQNTYLIELLIKEKDSKIAILEEALRKNIE